MFSTLKRLLSRSKDKEVPAAELDGKGGDEELSKLQEDGAHVHLSKRCRPELAAQVEQLRRKYSELQRSLHQLPQRRLKVRPGQLIKRPKPFSDPNHALGGRYSLQTSSGAPTRRLPTTPRGALPPASPRQRPPLPSPRKHVPNPATEPFDPLPPRPAAASPLVHKLSGNTLRAAAKEHRMRRLRAWSQQHQTGSPPASELSPPPLSADASFESDAWGAAKLQRQETHAWSILAELQLESIAKERLVTPPTSMAHAWAHVPSIPAAKDPRRRTEPPNFGEEVVRTSSRTHTEGEKMDGVASRAAAVGRKPTLGRPRHAGHESSAPASGHGRHEERAAQPAANSGRGDAAEDKTPRRSLFRQALMTRETSSL